MALMTTIYITSRILFNYAGSRTETRWVRVNKLNALKLFWYAVINSVALDTRCTNGLGQIKIVLNKYPRTDIHL